MPPKTSTAKAKLVRKRKVKKEMAKSMRSKKEKRLRAIRGDLVQPIHNKKDEAKLAALDDALAAPKFPVRPSPFASSSSSAMGTTTTITNTQMDMEMDGENQTKRSLKPIGKKLKKKLELAKWKSRGKGRIKRRNI